MENHAQRENLLRALTDLQAKSPALLMDERYENYTGKAGEWTLWRTLSAHVVGDAWPDEMMLQEVARSEEGLVALREWAKAASDRLLAFCVHHPGRPGAGTRFGKNYCSQCLAGIASAVQKVDAHVEPKECFVVFRGGDNWTPIGGTGCAHWVAHQVGTVSETASCIATRAIRVRDLLSGMGKFSRRDVRVNDIWANSALDHCGMVIAVIPQSGPPGNKITIRHDSSAQGGVRDNDFDTHFRGDGDFYR